MAHGARYHEPNPHRLSFASKTPVIKVLYRGDQRDSHQQSGLPFRLTNAPPPFPGKGKGGGDTGRSQAVYQESKTPRKRHVTGEGVNPQKNTSFPLDIDIRTLIRVYLGLFRGIPEVQDAFKNSMTRGCVRFALGIAVGGVLHRSGSQDIHC
jgi:hypothetical protein